MTLPLDTELGTLRIVDILDWYDGPKLFVAENAVGTRYFALWADEFPDANEWLYVPVSETRLNDLYTRTVSIREAYVAPEEPFVYRIRVRPSGRKTKVTRVHPRDLEIDDLPPEDDFLEVKESFSNAQPRTTTTEAASIHKIRVARPRARHTPSFEGMVEATAQWTKALRAATATPVRLLSASIGSFVVELASTNPEGVADFFRLMHAHLIEEQPFQATDERSLDVLRDVSRLLHVIEREKLTLTASITQGNANVGQLTLSGSRVRKLQARLASFLSSHLMSHQIPQADDLNRLLRLLEIVSEEQEVSTYTLKVTKRQVNYYQQAARILGLLTTDHDLTGRGWQLLRGSSREVRMHRLALAFEASPVGYAWLQWEGAKTIAELDPDKARLFLSEMVMGLSASTQKRRAVTLRSWAVTLSEYLTT